MTLLSVVVRAHRAQAFLRQCLTSILETDEVPPGDLEVLAIDDGSPDRSYAVLDEIAAADPRVRVRRLPETAGPGGVGNHALREVSGAYVWFVDGTDLLPAGSVDAVVAELRRSAPDVLLLDHAVVDPVGRTRPNPAAGQLRTLARKPAFTAEKQPGVLDLAPHAWDKVFRREFIAEIGADFGTGSHGELPLTYPALLSARRIGVLDRVAYSRRELPGAPRPGAEDLLAAYDAILDRVGGRGPRGRVTTRMMRRYLALLDEARTDPTVDRERLFHQVADRYRRHVQGSGAAPKSRVTRLRYAALARDSYPAFRAVDAAVGARATAERPVGAARRWRKDRAEASRRKHLQRVYRAELARPLDPDLAVFAAYWYRGYSCNPKAIYEKARELVPSLRGVWVVNKRGAKAMPAGVEFVVAETEEYYRLLARATYFINNVNFPNDVVKRPGTVHVQTHHGTPLKTMGVDLAQRPSGSERIDFDLLLARVARWDFSISANPLSTEVWERVYPGGYETLETGYPRNDVLVEAGPDDVAAVRAELGLEPGQKAILYAPTHREYLQGFVSTLDLASFSERLPPEFVLLVRAHYFYSGASKRLRHLHDAGRIVDVSGHESVERLCLAADILVTDYSSIMFDYAVLDRPIVVFAPDWDVYRTVRGVYFDLMAEPPGAVARTEDELVEHLRTGSAWGEEAAKARAAFRERFCPYEDGHAAERVVRRVFLGEPVTPPGRPAAGVTGG